MNMYAFAKDEVSALRVTKLSDAEKLTVYGLYKQAENGDVQEEDLNFERENTGSIGHKMQAYA